MTHAALQELCKTTSVLVTQHHVHAASASCSSCSARASDAGPSVCSWSAAAGPVSRKLGHVPSHTLSPVWGGHFLLNSYIICRSWNALFWLLLTDKTVYKEFFPTAAVWHQHSKFNSSSKSHKTSRPCLVCFRQQLHTRREQSCRLRAPDVWVKPPSGYSAGKTNATFRKTISRKTETDGRGEAASGAAGCKSGWAASRHWDLNQLLLIH